MSEPVYTHKRSDDGESTRFNKWFRSEVGAAFAFGAAIVGILLWVTNPINSINTEQALTRQSIDNIKNNDLTHIELEISAINGRLDEQSKAQIEQGKQITEILTLLKK